MITSMQISASIYNFKKIANNGISVVYSNSSEKMCWEFINNFSHVLTGKLLRLV